MESPTVTAPRKALELFLNLGVSGALITGALQPLAPIQAQTHQHHGGGLQRADEGGEGGEDGEGGGESHGTAVETSVDLLVVLAQMQGHLLVAQELLNQRQFSAAEPHVGHPVDELYGAVDPLLTKRGVAPFLPSLEALRQQVRLNPSAPATRQKLLAAQRAIQRAGQAAVPAGVRAQTSTQRAVVRGLSAAACSEYAAAVADGRVVETIEYQDARGYLLEAQRLLSGGGAAQAQALETVKAMLRAFPSAQPPQRTLLNPEQLQRLQGQL